MAASGLFQYQIAEEMQLSEDTLVKYYKHELATGWSKAMALATNVLVTEMENGGDKAVDAAKFFLSRRGKGLWADTKTMEVSGPGGGAIPIAKLDIDALDYDDLETIENVLEVALIEGSTKQEAAIDDDDDE